VGSNPTPRTNCEPTELANFGMWLLGRGNRESTVARKLRYLKSLNGSPREMIQQILRKDWCDKSKNNALDSVVQYSEFLGEPLEKPSFRVYQNAEMYVPNPQMIRQFLYRVRKIETRAMMLIAIETGASAKEIHSLKWTDLNLQSKTLTITGVKGHRTYSYQVCDELLALLMQIPKTQERIFKIKESRHINDAIVDYRQRLAKETNNLDFNKIHFHTLRHYAISWKYFKTKDIVETQRFARHYNIQNTLKYVHIIKSWVKDDEFNVVYAESKDELTKYLSEGYKLETKTEWGYCLTKPKELTE